VTTFDEVVPVLPVRDLAAATEHYRRLGFRVEAYAGGGYGFAERGPVHLHLAQFGELDPLTNPSTAYLYVGDADALHAEWSAAGAGGRFHAPADTEYGLREGAHVDPDGNLLRDGSWLTPPQ
jgi:catechol 2,3-dioxygenase-like lactoylglutathione lyase family enzyme